MAMINLDQIKKTYFLCGFLSRDRNPGLEQKIRGYGDSLEIHEIKDIGWFFFTRPSYAEIAENDEMVWIKLGTAHDGEQRISIQEMMHRGWLQRDGIRAQEFQGSVTIAGFDKQEGKGYVFRNLFSPTGLFYWEEGGNLLAADNLRLMSSMLANPMPDERVLLPHHIYRQVFGRDTYLQRVRYQLGGELLTVDRGEVQISLVQDFRVLSDQGEQKHVDADTVAWFFEQLSAVIGFRLEGRERQAATMLSGGVDSSTMQAAINTQPGVDFPFPSFSFVVDSPGFQFEVDYAREAAKLLGTRHEFLAVEPEKFQEWLVSSIAILGMPVHFDAPPSYFGLARYVQENHPEIRYLFNGSNADVLTGNTRTLDLVQGDKYHAWPVWLLKATGFLLQPVSPSKSHGARSAAETLSSVRDRTSIDNPFNRSSTCDWEQVQRSFTQDEIRAVFDSKWDYLAKYTASGYLSEQRQQLSLIRDGMSTPNLERQLALFCGREMWFPFTDQALVAAVFSFDPLDRYAHDSRVKPLMRMALEAQVPTSVTRKPKGNSSAFEQAVIPWMREGDLRQLVQEIERPGYISQADFQKALDYPGWFTWNMLTLDLFKKYGLQ